MATDNAEESFLYLRNTNKNHEVSLVAEQNSSVLYISYIYISDVPVQFQAEGCAVLSEKNGPVKMAGT